MRGMIDVPPPTSISKPFLPSLIFARKAMSWISEIARSSGVPSKDVLILRGISCVVGWRTK